MVNTGSQGEIGQVTGGKEGHLCPQEEVGDGGSCSCNDFAR